MANSHERWALHFTAQFYVKGRRSVPVDVMDCVRALQKLAGKPQGVIYFPDPPPAPFRSITNLIGVDLDIHPGKVVLLFGHIDKFKNNLLGHEETFKLREPERKPEEHGAITAHLLLNLAQRSDGTFGLLLEEAEGLSASRVSGVMNILLRKHLKLRIDGIEKIFSPTVRLEKVADVPFAEDLGSGELKMLQLSRPPTDDEFAAAPMSPPKEIIVKMGLPVSRSGIGAIASVVGIMRSPLAKTFPRLTVGYTDRNGKTRTAVEDLKPNQDKLTDLIHRKVRLPTFKDALPMGENIIKVLVDAMAVELDSQL